MNECQHTRTRTFLDNGRMICLECGTEWMPLPGGQYIEVPEYEEAEDG